MTSRAVKDQLISNGLNTDDISDDTSENKGPSVSTSTHSSGLTNLTPKQEMEIAKAESVAVFRLKLFVILVLVLSTAAVSTAVYKISYGAEQKEFENKYYDDSSKVFEAVSSNLDLTLGAIDSFVVNMVSLAKLSNQTWPFVTIPDYAIRTAKLRSSANAALVSQYLVVEAEQRFQWEMYGAQNQGWIEESLAIQEDDPGFKGTPVSVENYTNNFKFPFVPIHTWDGPYPYNSTGPFLPRWQTSPVVADEITPVFNYDAFSFGGIRNTFPLWEKEKGAFIGSLSNIPSQDPNEVFNSSDLVDFWNDHIVQYVGNEDNPHEPFGDIYYPILGSFAESVQNPGNPEEKVAGTIAVTYYFRDLLRNILPDGSDGIVAVMENDCGQIFSYQINGPDTLYLGPEDHHDPAFDSFQRTVNLIDLDSFAPGDGSYTGLKLSAMGCQYTMHAYPSETMEESYHTNQPALFTGVTVIIFIFTSVVFLLYDWIVERRQKKVMKSAVQTNAIVSSLFPSNVRDRLLKQGPTAAKREEEKPSNRLETFMHTGAKPKDSAAVNMLSGVDNRPIADLFPDCTVMFCDIAGFTAWSSTREPTQVFILLETIYGAFDKVADRRRVFKVETIGDSYVAACGLPDPRKDHAVVMTKFAADCREQFSVLTRNLESKLGPDTGDLAMRFGLHSGPVTAGVLRGQKSRFQLFGDTVNTAARMESTGMRNQIQVSQTTADCLIEAGKQLWLKTREETVEAKGKGIMQTYWAEPKSRGSSVYSVPVFPSGASSVASGSDVDENEALDKSSRDSPLKKFRVDKIERMIDWNVDILSRFIRQIVARRNASKESLKKDKHTKKGSRSQKKNVQSQKNDQNKKFDYSARWDCGEKYVLEEVKEIIELPAYDGTPDDGLVFLPLDESVGTQLYDYVITIARTYHDNPFHNFAHASHVAMSVAKLMSRITSTDALDAADLHDHTYGITSDPLTQFACIFAALIHDVDHPGVPNAQLVKEQTKEAKRYGDRSVAEQNSVDIAWSLLVEPKYDDLRRAVCETEDEMRRFRQLLVNSVMATDIMDKELKNLRNGRWEKAFSESVEENVRNQINRKATIVIEHLIQASDVAHTMQHWHIYRKWNEKLFQEMYAAFKAGRSEKDPSEFWYKGEMGFFDFYIIPLAKKLSECGVFGVSSDEYLNYAQANRQEWEQKGEELVSSMIKRLTQREEPEEAVFKEQGPIESQEPLKG